MSKTKFIRETLGAAFIAVLALAVPASASQLINVSNAAFAPVTGPTSIPIGAAEFCKRLRGECAANAAVVEAVTLDPAKWQQLLNVNADLNAEIVPETDEDLYHVAEFWTYPHGFGDCEDIALAKRKQLISDGWPASTLLMTVVKENDGEGHAVLMVRTDRGDLVLDNQDGMVRVWTASPYHFIKRQSQTSAAQWVGIDDERGAIITAGR
jgi:predicted transglutaminase-like cysteine proteinase